MPSPVNLVREISSIRATTLLEVQIADGRRSLSKKHRFLLDLSGRKCNAKSRQVIKSVNMHRELWNVYLVESSQVSVTVPGESDTIGARNRLIYVKGVARCESFMKGTTHQRCFVECFPASSRSCCTNRSQTAFHG